MTKKIMYLDVKAVIDFFDGGTNLSRLFDKYNFKPVKRAYFYKWAERKSMPQGRWLEIEYMAIKEGVYKELRKVAVLTVWDHPETSGQEQEASPSNAAAQPR